MCEQSSIYLVKKRFTDDSVVSEEKIATVTSWNDGITICNILDSLEEQVYDLMGHDDYESMCDDGCYDTYECRVDA